MCDIKIFASICEDEAKKQIATVASMDAFRDAKIRIMPDVHAGKGCVCGFTANLGEKVVPALIGVDINCGVLTVSLGRGDINLNKFDDIVHRVVPSGMAVNSTVGDDIESVYAECDPRRCVMKFEQKTLDYFRLSMASIGGGNHFLSIERGSDGTNYLLVHCGSRNFGKKVCDHYQQMAVCKRVENELPSLSDTIESIKRECLASGNNREISDRIIQAKRIYEQNKAELGNPDLAYLDGDSREMYLSDMRICQKWAEINRRTIALRVCREYGIEPIDMFDTAHNYLGDDNIIRKSAISARQGEKVVIPMNMRDGSLICIGRGNEDWNFSAPHGAGRIMSRSKARMSISMEDFKRSMDGIFTTSCVEETLDEAPDAYKPMDVISREISDTADVIEHIEPIYNFKGFN